MWKITLDKADAQLPSGLRTRLKDIVEGLKKQSVRVFQSRGGRIKQGSSTTQVWVKYVRNGEIRYYINREHPLFADLLEGHDTTIAKTVAAALGIIEDSFPAISIGEDVFVEKLEAVLPSLLHRAGGTLPELAVLLRETEPWAGQIKLVQEHLEAKGWWTNA